MDTRVIETMSIDEVVKRKRELGLKTSPTNERQGLLQKVYPYGDCVMLERATPTVYRTLFEKWVQERLSKEVTHEPTTN